MTLDERDIIEEVWMSGGEDACKRLYTYFIYSLPTSHMYFGHLTYLMMVRGRQAAGHKQSKSSWIHFVNYKEQSGPEDATRRRPLVDSSRRLVLF